MPRNVSLFFISGSGLTVRPCSMRVLRPLPPRSLFLPVLSSAGSSSLRCPAPPALPPPRPARQPTDRLLPRFTRFLLLGPILVSPPRHRSPSSSRGPHLSSSFPSSPLVSAAGRVIYCRQQRPQNFKAHTRVYTFCVRLFTPCITMLAHVRIILSA